MTASYRPSKAQLYFGTASTITSLNEFTDTGYAFNGVGNILQRTVLGQVNRTADGVDAGMTIRAALRYGAELAVGTRGYIVLRRTDAGDLWVVPSIITNVEVPVAAAGVVGDIYQFTQDGESGEAAMATDNVKTSGTVTLPSGGVGYDIVVSGGGVGVKIKSASFSVAGAFGGAGPQLVAEGA